MVLALLLAELLALGGCAASPRVPALAAVVPFDLWGDWIVVRASVNGTGPYNVVVDTGAPFSLVSPTVSAAAAASSSRGKAYVMRGVGGATRPVTRVDGLTARLDGGLELPLTWGEDTHASVFDSLSSTAGVRIDGLVGFDLFSRYVVEIDYDGSVLRLYEPAAFAYSGPGAMVSLRAGRGRMFIPARVVARDGDEPVDCLLTLDTGGGGVDVLLDGGLLARHALDERVRVRPAAGDGVAGDFPGTSGRLAALHLGPFRLTDVTAAFVRDDPRDIDDGLLCGGALRRFRVFVSFPHRTVILVPGRTFDEVRPNHSSGLVLEAFGPALRSYRVKQVLPDSPALDAGVREGDELVAVDGRPAGELTMSEINALLRTDDARALTLRRGEVEVRSLVRPRPPS
jgi:hypothetical protein